MEQKESKMKTSMFKDKKIIGLIIAIVFLLLVVGGFFMLKGNSSTEVEDDPFASEDLPELSPEDIGMEVTLRDDSRALMFELTKADDIEKVEYTIEYEKEIDGETVPEGIFGLMNIGEDGITKTDFREFGTCSAGKCRYDEVVSDITIVLKVLKADGKEYQVKKVVEL